MTTLQDAPHPGKLDTFGRRYWEQLLIILMFFVLSRLFFFTLLFVCQYSVGSEYLHGNPHFQYDGFHFTNIGLHGYQNENQYAFFPLFPLVIHGFAALGMPLAGPLIFNHTLALGVACMIRRIVAVELGKGPQTGMHAALFWIFSPLSVSTCTLYSEALFIALTMGAYGLYLRKKNLGAGLLLGLAILTRSLAAMLFFAILAVEGIRLLRSRDWRRFGNALKMLVPAGAIGALYPLYLQIKLGNWHYFVDAQYEHWARVKSNIIDMIYRDFTHLGVNSLIVFFTYASLLICLWIIYQAIRGRGDWVLILYLIFTILMVFSTARDSGSIGSFSFYRYLFGCLSVYLLLDPRMHPKLLVTVGAFMSIIATAVYCLGGFLI